MCNKLNPTIFAVKDDDYELMDWLIRKAAELERANVMAGMTAGGFITHRSFERNLSTLNSMEEISRRVRAAAEQYGTLYASYFRPGSYWETPVFVCPLCEHATLQDDDESDLQNWYCKYCYNTWHFDEKGFYFDRVEVEL